MANFDPYRIETTKQIDIEFGTGDYVGETTPYAKCKYVHRGFWPGK